MRELKLLRDEIDKCVKCGTCRSICPTFRVIGRETACMRGKLAMMASYVDGELLRSEAYVRHMKECTLCGACRDTCPNGVDTIQIITAARADVVEHDGLGLAASIAMKNLAAPGRLMPLALKVASRLQGLFMKDASVRSGLLTRFTLPGLGGIGPERPIPPLAKTFFLDMPEIKRLAPESVESAERGKVKTTRVAFFAGCGVNYLMPGVGSATLKVLGEAGVEVVVPPAQVCCGMPAFSMGDVKTAREMAKKNLEILEDEGVDFITTSCATCGHGLKSLMVDLLSDDPELKRRVEAVSSKVRDITELLVGELGFKGTNAGKDRAAALGAKATETVVTYHDPCHLNRAQGVRDAPRELLKSNPALEFKQMKFPCSCCGLGGGLGLSNYDLSLEIARRKAESIRDTGADLVATACPGCMVQLRDSLDKYGVEARVVHVVELL